MIKRIVQLTFKEEEIPQFLENFNRNKAEIRKFDGCHHLELLRHTQEKNVFFTLSHWESEEALNMYRNSTLFKTVWAKTKILFSAKPHAWSLENAENV